jgi:hypothetical protein
MVKEEKRTHRHPKLNLRKEEGDVEREPHGGIVFKRGESIVLVASVEVASVSELE